jgi:hypothetical protein
LQPKHQVLPTMKAATAKALLIANQVIALHQICVSHLAMLTNPLEPHTMSHVIVSRALIVLLAHVLAMYASQVAME